MLSELPHIDPQNTSLGWQTPCKRIYGPKEVVSFKKSVAIDRIQEALFLICDHVSLTDVPAGVLSDDMVDFEHAKHPGVSESVQVRLREKAVVASVSDVHMKKQATVDLKKLSKPVTAILDLLGKINSLIDETPPFPGPRRYGNMACRDWHDKLTTRVDGWLEDLFGEWYHPDDKSSNFETELRYYFLGSFGSRERLDFGTGHELSFLAFISSLLMCDILPRAITTGQDYLIIFAKYYDTVRKLIQTYTLEPAGSHGVWGLDDHFHLIYILGACQLVDFKKLESGEKSIKAVNYRQGLTPASTHDLATLKLNRTRNLFYNAIAFIKRVKFGPFSEHSPLLYEITTSKPWEKIAKGMLKMYYGEVLSKFPVVQHFYFGHVLYPWLERGSLKALPETFPENEEITGEEQAKAYDLSSLGSVAAIAQSNSIEREQANNKPNTSSEGFRSGAEVAMESLYGNREKELEKLHEERNVTSFHGKRVGSELPTSNSMWPSNTPTKEPRR